MGRPPSRSASFLQGTAALASIALLIVLLNLRGPQSLLATARQRASSSEYSANVVKISLEYPLPLSLSVTVTAGRGPGLLEVHHDSNETAFLTLPADWTLREVRGASLESIKQQTSLGSTRWPIAKHVTLSFVLPTRPRILLTPIQGIPLLVEETQVHLETGKRESRKTLTDGEVVEL